MMKKMLLQFIKAVPHPMGNRVDLQWLNPGPERFSGVRVMRREATHPVSVVDGQLVAEVGNNLLFAGVDTDSGSTGDLDAGILSPGLSAGFIANRVVLSLQPTVSVLEPGSKWLVCAGERMYLVVKNNGALDVYGTTSVVDSDLRAETVYYYTLFPYEDKTGQRIYIYDRSNRVSAVATGPYDFAGQMYRMLPIICHRYDTVLPGKAHREEMAEQDREKGQLRRFLDLPGMQLDQLYSLATAALDFHDINRVDGKLLPLLGQWIGWETDYNLEIARQRNEIRNAPILYEAIGIIPALEAAVVKCIGSWDIRTKEFVHNVFLSNRPERLNLWLCSPGDPGSGAAAEKLLSLDFAYEGRPAAAADETDAIRLFYHTQRNGRWEIWTKTYRESQGWMPSLPFPCGGGIAKYPAAALQDKILWVFWNSYDDTNQTWGIRFRQQTNGEWSGINRLEDTIPGTGKKCKTPCTLVDPNKFLWLFWLEKAGDRWLLKYNRHNGTVWETDSSIDFPADGGEDPRVEKDLFVLFHEKDLQQSIWVFWARKQASGSVYDGCWEIAYRQKSGVDSIAGGWGPIHILAREHPNPPPEEVYHDCEPAATFNREKDIEIYWASNRKGSWSVWYAQISDTAAIDLNTAKMLINDPYSQRTPLPLWTGEEISLVYRSNRSIAYESDIYRAMKTMDFRCAGCITVDPRDKGRNTLRGKYDEFQAYTYDTGKNGQLTNNNIYARDTIGLYLAPDTHEQQLITKSRELIAGILDRFLPIQTRAVFIIDPPVYKENVYSDDYPIKEQFIDSLNTRAIELYTGARDIFEDRVPEWIWFRSWSEESPDHHTVDFNTTPIDTKFRTWHLGIKK